jgi:hypothetical protein
MDDLDTKLSDQIRRILAHEKRGEAAASRQLIDSIAQLEGTMKMQAKISESLLKRIEDLEKSLLPLVEQLSKY